MTSCVSMLSRTQFSSGARDRLYEFRLIAISVGLMVGGCDAFGEQSLHHLSCIESWAGPKKPAVVG